MGNVPHGRLARSFAGVASVVWSRPRFAHAATSRVWRLACQGRPSRRRVLSRHLKATRGELCTSLPISYVPGGGRLRKDPDEQVEYAIGEVFAHFKQAGSARRTALALGEAEGWLPSRPECRHWPVRCAGRPSTGCDTS